MKGGRRVGDVRGGKGERGGAGSPIRVGLSRGGGLRSREQGVQGVQV